MPIPSRRTTAADIRSFEAGALLLGAGAILLLISLFLDWYQPGLEAWAIFEVLDLLLAALAVAALVAVAGRLGFGPPRPSSWPLAISAVAFVLVIATLIDPPPVANAVGGETETGIWLAFAGSALMGLGAVLSVARISIALNPVDPRGAPAPAEAPPRADGPFAREPVDPAVAPDPVAPGRRPPPTAPTRTM